ncbi:MAG TPA: hypothetical protein ACQGQH_07775 [Xylella sp.]
MALSVGVAPSCHITDVVELFWCGVLGRRWLGAISACVDHGIATVQRSPDALLCAVPTCDVGWWMFITMMSERANTTVFAW